MSDRNDLRRATAEVLERGMDDALPSSVFSAPTARPATPGPAAPGEEKPLHYKVICISMYTEDLARLDEMVSTLKARGLTKANRSALIRYALGAVDVDTVPKGL